MLEPGESQVCQVSFQSGLAPQILSGEIFCYARCEDPESEREAAADGALPGGLPPPAWERDSLSQAESKQDMQQQQQAPEGEQVEEIIAQHPER